MKKETKQVIVYGVIIFALLYALNKYGKKYQSVSDDKVIPTEFEN